jgi:serine protease
MYAYNDVTQSPATWGLDRIDQATRTLSNSYVYSQTGEGVKVYILDTGIKYDHPDFEGRAVQGFSGYNDNGSDVQGHGTHVAGTVGSKTFGVAKKATLVSVKVLSNTGSGSYSIIVAGMDWVVANKGTSPAVVNMSLSGSGTSLTANAAAKKFYDAKVPVIVAAGNSNLDAFGFTPANAPDAYAVGSSTSADARSSFSNYGSTVKLFALGSSITSTTVNGASGALSGTSMASPHVAGAAALLLQVNPTVTTQQIYDLLSTNSTKGIVTSSSSTNNNLLFTKASTTITPVTPPPTVDPTPSPITLTPTWAKVSGKVRVNLKYSGFASGSRIDIYRNGTRVTTTTNLTTFTDNTNLKGSGSVTFRVCLTGGTTSCSSTITVNY